MAILFFFSQVVGGGGSETVVLFPPYFKEYARLELQFLKFACFGDLMIVQAWNELNRSGAPKKQSECISHMKKKHKRAKLPNTVTIDSIYEKKFLSLNSVIEAVIIDTFILPGTVGPLGLIPLIYILCHEVIMRGHYICTLPIKLSQSVVL